MYTRVYDGSGMQTYVNLGLLLIYKQEYSDL